MRPGIALLSLSALLTAISPALAVESGLSPYPKGMAGFMSGLLPPEPGFYLTDTFYYFHGSADAEVRNGAAELGVGATMDADFIQGTYVTDAKLFGGTYAVSGALAYASAGLHATANTPNGNADINLGNSGLADSIFSPILLGWHDGNLHWTTGFTVYIPTGSYGKNELSMGKNIWGFMPQFGLTYFDPSSGWDVSSTLVYVTMTKNDATDYQSGDLLHMDWAIGKHFGDHGAWEVGMAGNLVQQIGADSGTGAVLGPFKAESIGLGPSITYTTLAGHTPVAFSAKWEHDLNHHNTFGGDVISVSGTIVF